MPLDTLKIAKSMEAAGMPRPQSEALATVLQDEYFSQLVTSVDLGAAVDRLETKIEGVEERLNHRIDTLGVKIDSVAQRMDSKVDSVGSRLSSRIDSVEARLLMMQWMLGLNLALLWLATRVLA